MVDKEKEICSALAAFTFLFVLAYTIDAPATISNLHNFSHFTTRNYLKLITVLLGIWTLLKPSSLARSIPFFVFVFIDIVVRSPRTTNHLLFEGFIILPILASFVYLKLKAKSEFTRLTFYETFAPAVRLEVIVLYFWAFFHKLNTGFFDQYISCATVQLFYMQTAIPFLPIYESFIRINPYLTLLTEALIPILLIIPKTRVLGMILGICFHFLLGFRYSGFTIVVYALYCLFIPNSSYEQIRESLLTPEGKISYVFSKFSHYRDREKPRFSGYIAQLLSVFLIVFIIRFFMRGEYKSLYIFTETGLYILISSAFITALAILVLRRVKELKINQKISFVPDKKWLLVFPALVFLNGLLPHVGLKNIQVFAMFSNLRTEGGKTNHLIIPASFQIFNPLKDLVSIHGSNIKELDKFSVYRERLLRNSGLPDNLIDYLVKNEVYFQDRNHFKLPFVMLQNMVTFLAENGVENIKIAYERDGEVIYTENAEKDPHLSNASMLQIKFLSQRPILDDERGICRW